MSSVPPTSRQHGAGRVMVVDDHAAARESIAETLRLAGHQVDCHSSAVAALRPLEGELYDVVVTDLQMPGVDGLEFIRRLQARDDGLQVIMVTAHATIDSAVEAMRRGAFDYIQKPFDAEQLESLVERAVLQRAASIGAASWPVLRRPRP